MIYYILLTYYKLSTICYEKEIISYGNLNSQFVFYTLNYLFFNIKINNSLKL